LPELPDKKYIDIYVEMYFGEPELDMKAELLVKNDVFQYGTWPRLDIDQV
jgi:hypothetical protein